MPEPRKFEGRVLDLQVGDDGYPVLKLDNGPVRVINIATTLDRLETLLSSDLQALHTHLMVRKAKRFRIKKDGT